MEFAKNNGIILTNTDSPLLNSNNSLMEHENINKTIKNTFLKTKINLLKEKENPDSRVFEISKRKNIKITAIRHINIINVNKN